MGWGLSEIDLKTKISAQVVYLANNPRRHCKRAGKETGQEGGPGRMPLLNRPLLSAIGLSLDRDLWEMVKFRVVPT